MFIQRFRCLATSGFHRRGSNQQISFSYVEPRLFDTSNLIGISLNYTERGQSTTYSMPFDSKSYGGGIRLGRRFNWPDKFFKGTWMINGSKRKYYSSDEANLLSYYSSSIQDYIVFENNQYVFSTSGFSMKQSITRDNRDHPEFPTQGSHFNWTFTLSGGILGCLLYTSPSPRDGLRSRMPSSA